MPLLVFTNNQAERRSSAVYLLARWKHKRTTARWSYAQGYLYSWHQLQAEAPFRPECIGLSQFKEDTCLSENLFRPRFELRPSPLSHQGRMLAVHYAVLWCLISISLFSTVWGGAERLLYVLCGKSRNYFAAAVCFLSFSVSVIRNSLILQ